MNPPAESRKRRATLTTGMSGSVARPGTYALILGATRRRSPQIGRLGRMPVRLGYYVYVGSAFGAGGLRGRLSHHLRRSPVRHWHIDYLRQVTQAIEAWCLEDEKREHEWAQIFAALPGSGIPLTRFGASDCRCASHLFHFDVAPSFAAFRRRLGSASGLAARLRRISLA